LALHTDTDYETPKPVNINDFLPAGETQAEFESWLASCPSVCSEVRRMIQENISAAAAGGGRKKSGNEAAVAAAVTKTSSAQVSSATGGNDEDDDDDDDDDVLGVFGKQAPLKRRQSKSLLFEGGMDGGVEIVTGLGGGAKATAGGGKPTQWSQTQMASVTEIASIFLEEEVSIIFISLLSVVLSCTP